MFTQSSNPDFRLRILSEPCSAILSSAAETQAGVILLFSSTWNRERGGGCITFFLRFRELFRPCSSLAPGTPWNLGCGFLWGREFLRLRKNLEFSLWESYSKIKLNWIYQHFEKAKNFETANLRLPDKI